MLYTQEIAKILKVEKWGGQVLYDPERDIVIITNVSFLPQDFFSYLKTKNVKITVASSPQSLSGFEVRLKGYPNQKLKLMILLAGFIGLSAFIFPYFIKYI
jgi:hypothetical protein